MSLALSAKDPVVMTVNGEDVPLSEFEYLYLKNRQQQAELQPINDYADIFKVYKLKVADAKAMGIDTTADFRREYEQYRTELALPYITDSLYIKQLAREAYDRIPTEVQAYHIMRYKTRNGETDRHSVALLDSLRTVIANGGSFSELAAEYSQDRGSSQRGGLVGWLVPMRFPYDFEMAAYNLSEGQVSDVIESPVAYHLIMGGKKRENRGLMTASHIMKMIPRNATPEVEAKAKAEIDSLYAVVMANPNSFEDVAIRNSDDKNSARKGGILPSFYSGEMVEEFSDAAYALQDGEISAPVRSQYGWHIIKRLSLKPIESYEKLEPKLIQSVTNPNDVRATMINDRQREAYAKEFKLKTNTSVAKEIDNYVSTNGVDSLFYNKFCVAGANKQLFTYCGYRSITLGDVAPQLEGYVNTDPESAASELSKRVNTVVRRKLVEAKEEALEATEPEYRNLLHEFRDGSLLYEAGRQKVWDKAANDTIGLNQYFEQHKADYAWSEPRVKGFLVQAANDSVETAVKARLAELTPDQYITTVRKEFAGKAQIDKVLAPKGVNAMVDYIIYGGSDTRPTNGRYPNYFLYDYRMINAPEDVNDVKGLVISDYQNQLETEWVEEIKDKYPVTVNQKVLKKAEVK
jgi:peptidyl-prolyl cis-trans isomerase SurA